MTRRFLFAVLLIMGLATAGDGRAQGIIIGGSGAISRSFAGATTAAPLDSASALFWNPASMSGLEHSDIMLGGELIYADTNLSSSLPTGEAGRTRSDSGLGIFPGLAFVKRSEDSPLSFGVAMPTIAGGGVNFPGVPGNPALSPTGTFGSVVLGPNASNALIFQLSPAMAYQVTEKLSVGFGPTIDVAIVSFDPAYFANPNDANNDGLFNYPTATHSHPFWGGGFKAGAYYHLTSKLDVGFSYISPQWFQTWKFYARDEIGRPQTLYLNATLPAIYSWGLAYKATSRLLFATDLRFFDYKNTDLFGQDFRSRGLGWSSVFATAVGSQFRLNDKATLRAGYLYNQNPLPDVGTFFNAQLPAVIQHTVSAGFSYSLTESMLISLAYVHGFKGSSSGSALEALGVNVGLDSEYDSLLFGLNFKFGGGSSSTPAAADAIYQPVTPESSASVNPSPPSAGVSRATPPATTGEKG